MLKYDIMISGDSMERIVATIFLISVYVLTTAYLNFSIYSVIPISIGIFFIGVIELSRKARVKLIFSWLFLIFSSQIFGLYSMIPILGFIHPLTKKNEILNLSALLSVYVYLFRREDSILYCTILFLVGILLNIFEQKYSEYKELYEKLFIEEFLSRRKYQENREQWNSLKDGAVFAAIVNERNHITRDIHDGVGHMISRAILQTGALIVTESDLERKQQMLDLKETLTESMTAMRKSLHNLQSEIVDLKKEIHRRAENFTYCPMDLQYDLFTDLPLKVKYSLINIVDESMNNVIKHSNATELRIGLRESGQHIYILIQDNGTVVKNTSFGMGLKSMESRVIEIGGSIQFSTEKGFRIFIQIPVAEISQK